MLDTILSDFNKENKESAERAFTQAAKAKLSELAAKQAQLSKLLQDIEKTKAEFKAMKLTDFTEVTLD